MPEETSLPLTHPGLTCMSLILSFSDPQDPVVCLAGHPDGPPISSSSGSTPAAPQATIPAQVSGAFSSAEPLSHPPVTQNPASPTRAIHLPSPQPTALVASSPTTDTPPKSGTVSSPLPQTDLSHTLPPVKSSLSSPTTSVPVNVITTNTPPDETGKYEDPSCCYVCYNLADASLPNQGICNKTTLDLSFYDICLISRAFLQAFIEHRNSPEANRS